MRMVSFTMRELGGRGCKYEDCVTFVAGFANFLFFRRPKGWLYWLVKQAVFVLSYISGSLQRLDLEPCAPLATVQTRLPVVIFSHGLGGQRGVYSIICAELASHGYIVFAIEHADGTASCAKLAGGQGYRYYSGLGGEEGQVEKTRYRVREMKTALRVLKAMHKGETLPGLSLSTSQSSRKDGGHDFLHGMLDLRCIAAIGHSYGGATTAALISEDPLFRCGICLDPWWAALPPESAALSNWRTKSPILVMGSHDWNVPNSNGELLCGGARQESLLKAARIRSMPGECNGAGAMLLVIAGSSHNTFADPLPLFSGHVGWALRALGLSARLDPVLGIHLVNAAILNFLSLHLPLTGDQRQLQTWTPSSGHSALDRIAELDRADKISFAARENGIKFGPFTVPQPLKSLFPGRGLLYAISDTLLDSFLWSKDKGKDRGKGKGKDGAQRSLEVPPEDVLSGEEVLETAFPSAEPSLGLHPHAPGSPIRGLPGSQGKGFEDSKLTHESEEKMCMDARQRHLLQARLGTMFSDAVKQEHVDQMLALLGEDHVFKCTISM